MFINIKNKKNKGFSLAEVLLTLIIIGIVASLTVPTLIQNAQNHYSVARVKRYQSILNQAINRYSMDNGCIGDLSQCDAFSGNADSQRAWDAIKPYFNLIKDCGLADECFIGSNPHKFLNGNSYLNLDNVSLTKGRLVDGMSIMVEDNVANCITDRSRSNTTPLFYVCGYIIIDTNGEKNPNQLGRDTFEWWVTRKGVYPIGTYDDSYYSYANGTSACDPLGSDSVGPYPGDGRGCTSKILKEGEMNY